jgi:hypothetical protein
MSAAENREKRRPKKWVVILTMVFLPALVCLFYLEEDVRGKWGWSKFKHAEEASGEKFAVSDFVPPAVPDEQNFAVIPLLRPVLDYTHGTTGTVWRDTNGWGHLARLNPGELPERILGDPEQGTLVDLSAVAAFYRGNTNYPQCAVPADPGQVVLTALNKFAPELHELKEAAVARPLSRFPIEYNCDPPGDILLPHLASIKGLTMLCELRAVAELETQHTQEALADLQLAFRLSDSIRDEPILIDHLVRLATLTIAIQGIREGIARHEWTDAQLRQFENYLANLDVLREFEHAARGERALQLGTLDYLRKHNGKSRQDNPSKASQPDSYAFYWVPGGWYYQNMRLIGEMYRDYILDSVDSQAHCVTPLESRHMQADLARRHPGPYNFYAKMTISGLSSVASRPARAQTWVDEARVACALERYRLEHHELPDDLEVLSPKFISKIPNDVIGIGLGQLHYRKNSDGTYVLYSVGWNGEDDGGVPGLRTGSTPRANNFEGDWVWQFPGK